MRYIEHFNFLGLLDGFKRQGGRWSLIRSEKKEQEQEEEKQKKNSKGTTEHEKIESPLLCLIS